MEIQKYALLAMENKMLIDENLCFIESQINSLKSKGCIVEVYVFDNTVDKHFTRIDLLKHNYTILEVF